MGKFCSKCGAENREGAGFCDKCGNKLNEPKVEENKETNQNQQAKPATNTVTKKYKNNNSTTGLILSICGIPTCGILSIIGLVFSIKGLSESKKQGKRDAIGTLGIIISGMYLFCIVILIYGVITAKDIEVVDFSTITREEATKWCEKQDANCSFLEEYSDTVEKGKFISQSKEKETTIKSYEEIEIVYSKGIKEDNDENKENNNSSDSTKETKQKKSTEEIKNEYKASCQDYGYKDIARQPDEYKGKKAKFRGKVIQVSESYWDSKKVTLRVDVTEGEYGFWDDTVYVTYKYKDGESKILEDDIINMYGTIEGTETYVSVLGAKVTIPSFKAKYIELEQ